MAERFAKYELLRKVGQGGMCEVYLARQPLPGGGERQLALKLLRPQHASDPNGLELFSHEARTAAQLRHPGICRIFDFGEENGRPFLAMEYLEGQTLSQTWRQTIDLGRTFPPLLAAHIVQRVAEVLAYAHAQRDERGQPLKIVHRDVSPQNIFLTTAGEVKLLDFGIARSTQRTLQTSAGFFLGKPGYLSPEQILGQETTAKSDVFALGIVLHEHLSGRRLFQGQADGESHGLTLYHSVPAPSGSPTVRALGEIALAALERDPERRLASATAFAQHIELVLRAADQRPGPLDVARYIETLHTAWADLPTRQVMAAFPPEAHGETSSLGAPAELARATRLLDPRESRPSWRRTALASAALVLMLVAATALALRYRAEHGAVPPVSEAPTHAPQAPQVAAETMLTPKAPDPAMVSPAIAPGRAASAKTLQSRVAAPPRVDRLAARVAGTGRLTLDTEPWTEILLEDRSLGTTPLVEVALPAGHYRLRAVNRAAQIDRIIETDVEPDRTVREKVRW
jgi:serine/threonine protein kinase